ncbi:hypothetical protein NIES4102_22480 [Chondrocystis sp. NIES-4102]|nr:hypothetical protein NIES4102_22480 [Chondrocystis sp. NIES-4102]
MLITVNIFYLICAELYICTRLVYENLDDY